MSRGVEPVRGVLPDGSLRIRGGGSAKAARQCQVEEVELEIWVLI